jgi:hypothetical protein
VLLCAGENLGHKLGKRRHVCRRAEGGRGDCDVDLRRAAFLVLKPPDQDAYHDSGERQQHPVLKRDAAEDLELI